MRYSLSSRFRGALLGAVLGEKAGRSLSRNWAAIESAKPEAYSSETHQTAHLTEAHSPCAWSQTAIDYLQELLRVNQAGPASFLSHPVIDLATLAQQPDGAGVLVTLLPIALFYHDDLTKFPAYLHPLPADLQLEAQVMATVLTLILHDRLDPLTIIPHLLATFPCSPTHPALADQLQQVQRYLTQEIPPTLDSPIAQALSAFLTTPHDWSIAVQRAISFSPSPLIPVIGSMTGALSGAHNGWAGLPVTERLHHSMEALFALADQCLAVWSGVYQPIDSATPWVQRTATAAPSIIRPR